VKVTGGTEKKEMARTTTRHFGIRKSSGKKKKKKRGITGIVEKRSGQHYANQANVEK